MRSFATWARRALVEGVAARAAQFGITPAGITGAVPVTGGLTVNGLVLDADEAREYTQLREHLRDLQRAQPTLARAVAELVDEIAYTWFNRLCALRFMEVNGFLGRRVLSSGDASLQDPDLLREAASVAESGDLPGVTLERLAGWRRAGDDELVYRKLLVAQCDALAPALPDLFGPRLGHTSLFLPRNLLGPAGLVRRLVTEIPEGDWRDVEIVGWLYQFYISEEKDRVIGAKTKVEAQDIPAATQLFTPHWIVRYMVENSVGRAWLEAHPDSGLRAHMPYYLEPDPANPPVPANPSLRPEDLTVMDPACGSGHILVYAFDLLFEIYREQGYPERDIPRLILANNLFGLEIDERAAQLASFAVLMRAREKDRRLLRDPPKVNVHAVRPTRHLNLAGVPGIGKAWQALVDAFRDADSLGSLIQPPALDYPLLERELAALEAGGGVYASLAPELRALLDQARLLSQRYAAVIANPPYMGSASFNATLGKYVDAQFPNAKGDLFAAFMERARTQLETSGHIGLITQQSWMFLSSYEALRKSWLAEMHLSTMAHMGFGAFGADFGTTAFTATCATPANHKRSGVFVSLRESRAVEAKEQILLSGKNRFFVCQEIFCYLPGSPIAYWVTSRVQEVFRTGTELFKIGRPKQGLATGENDQFVRAWFEPLTTNVGFSLDNRRAAADSERRWFPYNKGGDFRKWYGNQEWVVNWQHDGAEVRKFGTSEGGRPRSRAQNTDTYFRESASWSKVTSGSFALRYFPPGFIYDVAGCSVFSETPGSLQILLAVLNSKLVKPLLADLAPTVNFEVGQVSSVPILGDWRDRLGNAKTFVERAISLSKSDWEDFETSWDFGSHPLVRGGFSRLSEAFAAWEAAAETRFRELQRLEEQNNRYWIDAYGLQDELTPEVPDEQVTVRRADLERDVRSLVSYAVGCMLGRYSLDEPGLVHAGQPFDPSRHRTFPADEDGIVPVTDEPYFDDDLAARFVRFLEAAYGPGALEENLAFVARALGPQRNEAPRDTVRRYLLNDFISDHIHTYKKRPIYWLFTSGKRKGFNALVYLHRMDESTLARLRTDYALELQVKLEAELARLRGAKGSPARVAKLEAQVLELREYQAKLQNAAARKIRPDLDDGVAYNYTLFKGLVYEGNDLKMADLEKKSQWKRDLLRQAGTA